MRTNERHVYTVDSIDIDLLRGEPPQLWIRVDGTTRSPGYTTPRLVPRACDPPPASGILEFDFVATPPVHAAPPVVTVVHAAHRLADAPSWLRGVRVVAEANHQVARPKVVLIDG